MFGRGRALALLLSLTLGCGGRLAQDASPMDSEAGDDATVDHPDATDSAPAIDATVDAGPADAATDTPQDVVRDVPEDIAADAPRDAEGDAPGDAGVDGKVDAGCGVIGSGCCAGDTCTTGVCNGGTCEACGGLYEKCCAGRNCDPYRICYGAGLGSCHPCGSEGMLCCPNNGCGGCCEQGSCIGEGHDCGGSRYCHVGTCEPCGNPGQICCGGGCWNGGCCDHQLGLPKCVAPDAGCSFNARCINYQCTFDAG